MLPMMTTMMIHHVTFVVTFFNSNDQTTTHTHTQQEKKEILLSCKRHKENELKQEAKQDNRGSKPCRTMFLFIRLNAGISHFYFAIHGKEHSIIKINNWFLHRIPTYRNDRQVNGHCALEEDEAEGREGERNEAEDASLPLCVWIYLWIPIRWINIHTTSTFDASQTAYDTDKFHSIFHGPFLFVKFVKNRSPPNTRINFFSIIFDWNRFVQEIFFLSHETNFDWVDLFFIHELS